MGARPDAELDPGFLKDDGKLVTITFQECCRKTIWTRFLTVGTVQIDICDFMALDTDTTLAEIGTPLVKQILAMQGKMSLVLAGLAEHLEFTLPCTPCHRRS